jgi:soluble lytic murein transglycosylase-like protein
MWKQLIGLLALLYVACGVLHPAFAQETTYTWWDPRTGALVISDTQPDYEDVEVFFDLATASRPASAAPLALRRPTTAAARIEFSVHIDQWDHLIVPAALQHKVPAELGKAIMLRESGMNPHAVSPTGARGLMQFIISTAKAMGVKDRANPAQSVNGGFKYIRVLLDEFAGRPNQLELAIAAYNAGPQAVKDAGYRIPPKEETQVFVPNVLAAYKAFLEKHPLAGADAVRPQPGHPLYPR